MYIVYVHTSFLFNLTHFSLNQCLMHNKCPAHILFLETSAHAQPMLKGHPNGCASYHKNFLPLVVVNWSRHGPLTHKEPS